MYPIDDIIADIKKGKMVIVVDDEERENEGDIVLSAKFATAEKINFITKNARGLICVPLSKKIAEKLNLYPMDKANSDPYKTNWLISVDAKNKTTTGISAEDRAETIRLLANSKAKASDFTKPGHMFPLLARDGGVLVRAGHTEAAVDLMKLSGLAPVAVICEIMKEDGRMARIDDLIEFSKKYGLKITSIEKIIEYRRRNENMVKLVSTAKLPTRFGNFDIRVYKELITNKEHVALIKGRIKKDEEVMVRVHSECLTGDVLGSLRCDCGPQLEKALEMIGKAQKGVLLYMRQEGRGIGLGNKIKAYHLQENGYDTVEANHKLGFKADLRDYGIGAQILKDIGIRRMILLTNNPKKIIGLKGYGLEVTGRLPIKIKPNRYNKKYLLTKKIKMGHFI
ncbi:MAG: bifunctional 3,4-dihydroxy-2-butanone-4-phosphate synthase/GTP cyclohydrolase II [Elusimicrobiales bacterium]|nr:bifunctional 3,4-dihydroxy-2-butanone-4-phosphate synthase/GTP cyclohydrolase II [Elusimicrobiales bacterium]NLH39696.1 bifunctional 3,4-dihydroxy-2-butanone-4-phosphate synthase/GTP cyclohydrolase II [Elusimicrobiota bacterium]